MNKQYLGDGVYVERNKSGHVVLTTEDGISATNTIYLEPEVMVALLRWLQHHQERDLNHWLGTLPK